MGILWMLTARLQQRFCQLSGQRAVGCFARQKSIEQKT